MAKGRSIPLLVCLVLLALVPGVMNGAKDKNDIGDTIAVLYPDDADLSAKILAKYIDLKHLLPYYILLAEQEQFEAAKKRLESAQKAAQYAKNDLDESLQIPLVVTAGVMEAEEETTPSPQNKKKAAPAPPETEGPPAPYPDRLPPRQITVHPYRLEEAAPEIAKYFAKEDLIKHWPK